MTRTQLDKTALKYAAVEPDRSFPAESLFVPAFVKLEAGFLVWKMAGRGSPYRSRKPEPDLLMDFLRLAHPEAEEEAFRAFAHEWGMLGICVHGVPGWHGRYAGGLGMKVLKWCLPRGGFGTEGRERIEHWRITARRLTAILNISARLHRDERGREEDWRIVLPSPSRPDPEWQRYVQSQQKKLADVLTSEMIRADVRHRLVWEESEPQIRVGGNGLYGVLVAQLALAVGRATGWFTCAACGLPALRTGRASTKRHTYCRKCGIRGAWRVNQAESRRVKREARRRYAEGTHPKAIAKELARPEAIIRKWVEAPTGSGIEPRG